MDQLLHQATGFSNAAARRRLDAVDPRHRRAGRVMHHVDLFSSHEDNARALASLTGADAAVLSRAAAVFGAEVAVLTTHLADALRPNDHVQAVFAKRDRANEVMCAGFRYRYTGPTGEIELRENAPVHLPGSRSGQEILSTLDRCLAGPPIGAESVLSSLSRMGVSVLLYDQDTHPMSGQWIDTEHGMVNAPKGADLSSVQAIAQALALTTP